MKINIYVTLTTKVHFFSFVWIIYSMNNYNKWYLLNCCLWSDTLLSMPQYKVQQKNIYQCFEHGNVQTKLNELQTKRALRFTLVIWTSLIVSLCARSTMDRPAGAIVWDGPAVAPLRATPLRAPERVTVCYEAFTVSTLSHWLPRYRFIQRNKDLSW